MFLRSAGLSDVSWCAVCTRFDRARIYCLQRQPFMSPEPFGTAEWRRGIAYSVSVSFLRYRFIEAVKLNFCPCLKGQLYMGSQERFNSACAVICQSRR